MVDEIGFAVIIPVYNAEDFIAECLDSLLAQTYNKWVAYCVNDGSKDNTPSILDQYAIKDSRIKVYHKENEGVAKARNYALVRLEEEQWISFIDADDFVSPYMYECIAQALKSYSNNTIDYIRLFPKRTDERYSKISNFSRSHKGRVVSRREYFENEDVGGFVASLLVKSSIVKGENVRFVEAMRILEDQVFSIECAVHATSILMYYNDVYFYYSNPCSATMSSVDRSIDIVQCINNVKRIIDQTGDVGLNYYFKERFMSVKIRMLIKERLKHLLSKSKGKMDFNIKSEGYNIPVVDRLICFFLGY